MIRIKIIVWYCDSEGCHDLHWREVSEREFMKHRTRTAGVFNEHIHVLGRQDSYDMAVSGVLDMNDVASCAQSVMDGVGKRHCVDMRR